MAMHFQLHQRWSLTTPAPCSPYPTLRIFVGLDGRLGYGRRKEHCRLLRAVNGKDSSPFAESEHRGTIGTRQNEEEERSLSPWMNEPKEEEIGGAMKKNKVPIGNEGEDPYRILESGRKVYLDELDILTLLDPPAYLIPNDANTYDQAAYLWKKIGDIPEQRRHRLLDLLTSKQVQAMWEIAGGGPGMSMSDPGSIFLGSRSESFMNPVTWNGKLFSDSWLWNLISRFQKTFFLSTDASIYGRVIIGGILKYITTLPMPLYFEVREIRKVAATEEACNISFEYGDGQLHLQELPQRFPKPVSHLWPFNDGAYDYVRVVGPGVIVGRWWIESKDLETIPKKVADFIMVQDFGSM